VAFCIYDTQKKTLLLSRDRFGVKPLLLLFRRRQVRIRSELKAIRPLIPDLRINTTAVNYFFTEIHRSDMTIYDKCWQLKPSENLIFDLDKKQIHKSTYSICRAG